MSEHEERRIEALDADYETGAVEDGDEDMLDAQILPVWASTEPYGYEGNAADKQVVGGGGGPGSRAGDAGRSHADREIIGPDAG